MTHLYACLVHERPDCILDLVRNLRALDPVSAIVLYNGGRDRRLLDGIPELDRLGVTRHPNPSVMKWGALHEFALDCMRFGLSEFAFDAMTIVDSDQLMVRGGYAELIASTFASDSKLGMLGNSPLRQDASTKIPPCVTAHEETELWRPFLRRFEGGLEKWVHWSFWPSTVFGADACRELLRLFESDPHLKRTLQKSRLWATEEVLFPTLVSLLGFRVGASPCNYDFVKYRARYTTRQITRALERGDVFWLHPVKRQINDPIRKLIRSRISTPHAGDGYAGRRLPAHALPAGAPVSVHNVPRILPLMDRMQSIDGWLEVDEADLVITAALKAMSGPLSRHAVVEVGSYCGRATVLLGSVAEMLDAPSRIVAIDTFDGVVGAADRLERRRPTLDRFERNLDSTGLRRRVEIVVDRSFNVDWEDPIGLLLIDGLHDYANVARDFRHFESHLAGGAFILFHDYARYFPGVMRFVDELLDDPAYEAVGLVGTMMLIRREDTDGRSNGKTVPGEVKISIAESVAVRAESHPDESTHERISCIMPTCDRREFVPTAIALYRGQDYPDKELIVIDDGRDAVADLIPDDPEIHYVRLPRRVSIGEKRNMAAEMASGRLIAHWDDDDWYGSRRLRIQSEAFADPKCSVCGLGEILFVNPAGATAWRYRYPHGGRPWVYGATLMYRKAVWRSHPFREVNEGEDTRFVWNVAKGIRAAADHSWFVGRIHPGNTSRKRTAGARWTQISIEELVSATRGEWSKACACAELTWQT